MIFISNFMKVYSEFSIEFFKKDMKVPYLPKDRFNS